MSVRGLRNRVLLALLILLAGLPASGLLWAQGLSPVYRILILDNQTFDEARKGQQMLESWDYQPIVVDQQGQQYRVLYGNFANEAAANVELEKMRNEGIAAVSVVAVQPQAPAPAPTASATGTDVRYAVFVREFADEAQAQSLRQQMQLSGVALVMVRPVGRFFQVYAGSGTMAEATALMGSIRQQGFAIEGLTKVVVAPAPGDTQRQPLAPAAQPGRAPAPGEPPALTPAEAARLSPGITGSAAWQELSADQQRKVINSILMQQELRSGDPMAERMVDINKRLESLDERLKGVINMIEEEKKAAAAALAKINELSTQAENLIRSGQEQQAVLKLREVLEMDPDNRYGQRPFVQRRITMLESKMRGEDFEGQGDVNRRNYTRLREEANQLSGSGATIEQLRAAVQNWRQIRGMDATQFGEEAQSAINSIENRIQDAARLEEAAASSREKQARLMTYGVIGGVALLSFILIFVVSMRSRKRHTELMRKMQEITSIRPMRELAGSTNAGLLESRSGSLGGNETDVFSPRTPGSGDSLDALDPLGGIADAPDPKAAKGRKGKGAPAAAPAAASAAADPFGDFGFGDSSSTGGIEPPAAPMATPPSAGGDDFGFDDIFGGGSPAAEGSTNRMEAAPTEASSVGDVTFGNLFDGPSAAPAGDNGGAPRATPKAPPAQQASPHEVGPISFDDLVSVAEVHAQPDTPLAGGAPNNDLLAMFDNVIGAGEPSSPATATSGPSADDPFNFMNDLPSAPSVPLDDETEIPSIKLDGTNAGLGSAESAFSFEGLGGTPESDRTNTSLDLPSFNFDDMTALNPAGSETVSPMGLGAAAGIASAAASQTAAFAGVELDFEDDSEGQPPAGWEGDYPFATLTVKGDSPPKGAHQYIAFEKREGAGKAYFSYRFPEISGLVGIEFDMRCNDKNKFLLGFYIEKDGDFQQSVHTKILRSEAQTTPTIHMQGESAPYLLGSWAHIKYVVDLRAGKLSGYIDSTQVVRDLPLSPNPGSLNTLSIRDNINTTGVLLLDNIKVTQLG